MRCQLLALSASALVACAAGGQLPQNYHLGMGSTAPDTLTEVLAGGRFHATVRRTWRSARERQLISTAERLYPSTAAVLGATGDADRRDRLASMSSGILSGERPSSSPRPPGNRTDRWWFDSFDDTWVPFAVTGATLDYYLGRIRDIAAGRGKFTYANGEPADEGTLDYRATVRRDSSAGHAYVVELRLRWSYWCGDMCAMSFTQTRAVTFDSAGSVIGIAGDERPLVSVS